MKHCARGGIVDGTCRYDGPLALQAGLVEVTVDAQDQDKQGYAVGFFTLDPGKGFTDLMASTTRYVPPPWSKMFSLPAPARLVLHRRLVIEGRALPNLLSG